jgi:transposase
MAGRRRSVLDIREIVRRFRLGEGDRRIARDLQASRNTIAKYREWAEEQGFLGLPELPAPGVIEDRLKATKLPDHAGPASSVEPHRGFINDMRSKGVEIRALLKLLEEQKDFRGSYSALRRFVVKLEAKGPENCLRVETPPGEEAQVDFGFAGKIYDPLTKRHRKAWVFVMTLCFSRHQYAEMVFDQKVETWVDLHVRAFEWFGGVVKRAVIDNLKAGIVKAVVHDAEAQRSYRELAEHYGFAISPCRPKTPRHKGKVESGVRYVKRNALAGREFADIHQANEHLKRWVMGTAGLRDHGTTHEAPLARFEAEKEFLLPLPAVRYEVTVWKQAKLHPDCHIVFDYAYYSAPYRLVGQELWLRATRHRVEIYHEHERIASHPRATKKGQWATCRDHYPREKVQGLLPQPVMLRAQAKEIGSATGELVDRLLGERPLDRLRGAQGILRLRERYGPLRLEAASRRALAFDQVSFRTVKTILVRELDLGENEAALTIGPLPKTAMFARPISELIPAASY